MEQRKTRNRPTNYDVDIHIRIRREYLDKINAEANERGITQSVMTRLIIEKYFHNEQAENCETQADMLQWLRED